MIKRLDVGSKLGLFPEGQEDNLLSFLAAINQEPVNSKRKDRTSCELSRPGSSVNYNRHKKMETSLVCLPVLP